MLLGMGVPRGHKTEWAGAAAAERVARNYSSECGSVRDSRLRGAQVGARLEQVGGEAVPQCMGMDVFLQRITTR